MGQQQLLLMVLGIIIVGIAITVGISMFRANAVEMSRNAIIDDLAYFASRARQLYLRPRFLGGVERDFSTVTLRMLSTVEENENARYFIEDQNADELIIVGVGKIVVHNDSIRIRIRINEAKNEIEILN